MKTSVYVATSLDGFIARKDGALDWLDRVVAPPSEDYGYKTFISAVDAIVMGRGTFEKALGFPSWPYNNRKVFVLSSTMQHVPRMLKDKVSILSMKPKEVLRYLSERGYSNVYVDGGIVIQNFLRDDCIDELIITKIPVLLGNGIPLFDELEADLDFTHLETLVYPNGLVKSHYVRKRS